MNDAVGRLMTRTVTSDASYQLDYGYNALGALDTLTYPVSTAGYRLKLQYDYSNGIPVAIKDFNAPTTVIWSSAANDARGAVIDETLGTNLRVLTGRDPLTGHLEYRQAGVGGGSSLQNLAYGWDVNDNLTSRGDANQAGSCNVAGYAGKLCETFSYDSLERLDTVSRNGTQTLNVDYDLSGNITSRSDVGNYSYHASKKHAVTAAGPNTYAYDANGNVITRNGATLGWASYDLPTSLVAGGNTAQFAYAPDRSRWRQVATTSGVTETTIYVAGLLEKVTKPSLTLWKHTVIGPTGLGAVYVRRSDGTADTYYLTTDHLGSTDKIVKGTGGTLQVAESFAPYGARRGSTWTGAPSGADLIAIGNTTPNGFTGHEMLDGVGLIHMNGRVYDPGVGRFLSVDPLVRDAAASQSWNGYGYVEGRVLSFTDPSGYTSAYLGMSLHSLIQRIEPGANNNAQIWDRIEVPFSFLTPEFAVLVSATRLSDADVPWGVIDSGVRGNGSADGSGGAGSGGSRARSAKGNGKDPTQCLNWDGTVAPLIDDLPIEPVYPELWFAVGRGIYSLATKLIPSIAVVVEDTAMGQAAYANAARNSLKDLGRGPFAPFLAGIRQPSFAELLAQAGGDPYAVIASAGRSNTAVDAMAVTTAAMIAASPGEQTPTETACP